MNFLSHSRVKVDRVNETISIKRNERDVDGVKVICNVIYY